MDCANQKNRSKAWTLRIFVVCLPVFLVGCRSLRPADGEGLFSLNETLSIDNITGPLERSLVNRREEDSLAQGARFSEEGRRDVERARKLFEDRKFVSASKAYKRIADRYEDSAIGEEAWFRIGESHFALKQYPKAQDAYDKLFSSYPSTKYVSDASKRLFVIAKAWLEVSEPEVRKDIKTVSQSVKLDDQDDVSTMSKASDPSAKYSLIPNFFDPTRPFLDTKGRARNALKAIWLNDPTGPLADDALMLSASYYLNQGNFIEADRYLEILRDEYPDSPHLEDAMVLGTAVKQAAYQGPMYDNTALVAAENLSERSLMLFPNSESRPKMKENLNRIYAEKARAAWAEVEFWKRKDNPRSVAINCRKVIEEYPDTRYATRARAEFMRIRPEVYAHLPGMKEFADYLREMPAPTSAGSSDANDSENGRSPEPRTKSVSQPSGWSNPFRLLGGSR